MENDSSYGQVLHLPRRTPSGPRIKADQAGCPALTDIFPLHPFDPSATGFLLSLLPETTRPALWIQDRASRQENGQIYGPSLPAFGMDRPVLQVHVSHPRDVLWAMEEGAACAGLSAVIGEIHGAPAVLDFTATKRLAMRADASGVPVFLIRSGDPGGLSAARERWRVGALPSQPDPLDVQAPGKPHWDADLFRARTRRPGRWRAQYDPDAKRAADRLRLVSRTDDRALEAGDQPIPHRPRA